MTIAFAFLVLNSQPFFLLSSSTMSNNCCKSSSFYAINTVSSAYFKLFMLCPPTLIPRKKSKKSNHPCQNYALFFLNELLTPSTCMAAVCSQYRFLITRRFFPSHFNSVSCVIVSTCRTKSNALV